MIKTIGLVVAFIILIAITILFSPSAPLTLPFMVLCLQMLGVIPK